MNRFLSYVASPIGIAALVIIAAACYLSTHYSQHHEGENVFTTLYMHIVPAPLVKDPHDPASPALLEVPLPSVLASMDYRHDVHASEPKTVLFNLQIFQIAAVVLVLVCFARVPSYLRTGKGDPLTRVFAGFAQWIREEMVIKTMGKEVGARFLPYFLTVFFFILFMNLMGLVPFAATATASIFVTGALALTTFTAMIVCGMVVQGPVAYWKHLVPHVPLPLWPLMFVVELIGLIVKPVALTIRLFANMSGGHMVVLSFMGLIFFMGSEEMWGTVGGWGTAPLGLAFAVFIMIIESFVAMVQAYIFTQLSILFVNASMHPEH